MNLINVISKDLNIPTSLLNEAISRSHKTVTHIKIPKRDGSIRLVYQPSKKIKILQYWLMNNIFNKMNVHDCAMAYQKDRSIKLNAETHQNNRYFLKLDFKNFFPSIKFNDFSTYVSDWSHKNKLEYDIDQLLNIINKSCFLYKDYILPIGFPSSPIISNIVMNKFDTVISEAILNKDIFGTCKYTRYADDLTFSTDLKGACKKIKTQVARELREMNSPKLKLNPAKTKFVSSSGGSAYITGLRICNDGHITIHRKYKDKIRLLLSLYKKGQLKKDEIPSLKGHLSYVKNADSPFYTKLQKKYFKTISKLRNDNNQE